MDALTKEGLDIYYSSFQNFGIDCGDNYITSYKEGVLLLHGVVVEFETMYDKNVYESHLDPYKIKFTDIVELT